MRLQCGIAVLVSDQRGVVHTAAVWTRGVRPDDVDDIQGRREEQDDPQPDQRWYFQGIILEEFQQFLYFFVCTFFSLYFILFFA